MKFVCDKNQLITALTNVQGAISTSAIAALEGFYINTEGERIYIAGYNLEVGISTVVPARISRAGAVVLNAALFLNLVKKLPDDLVEIEVDDKDIAKIRSGETEYSIIGIPSDEYPQLPRVPESKTVTIPEKTLKSLVRQTRFAVAKNDANPVHTGILFELENGKVTAVAVDGYRLAMAVEDIVWEQYTRFIIPERALSEVMKMLRDDSTDPVTIEIGPRNVLFEVGQYSYVTRLLDGDFLDYRSAIPTSHKTTVEVSTRAITELMDRITPIISDKLKSPVRCIFSDDRIKASCSTAIGTASDRIPARTDGDRVEIGFNNRYMLEALKACESDEIRIMLGGALSPMKIVPKEGDSFLFLVLPVRLKTETNQ